MILVEAIGRYRDTFRYKTINGFDKTIVSPWRKNQIQDSALNLITAQLIDASTNTNGLFINFGAINYIAFGSGDVAWDADPNNVNKPVTQTTLTSEIARIAITADNFTFLDNGGVVLNPQSISPRFKMEITLGANDANGDLREFGLFGGETTANADTGTMFNWITHPLIQKDNTLVIDREVDIQFSINRS